MPAVVGAQDTTAHADSTRRDSVTHRLAPVVTVARDAGRSPLVLPYAITAVTPDSARPGQPHTQLSQTLAVIPGLQIDDRGDPAQDPRITVRGFGERTQFGVRSVRILRDEIPLTDPDGQTAMDILDIESIGRVDIIRGAAASLYGNASGGVVDFHTAPAPTSLLAAEGRGWWGSDGFQHYVGLLGGTDGLVTYQGNLEYTTTNGYRAYSELRQTSGFGRATASVGQTKIAFDILGLDKPVADDNGALTEKEWDSDPRMADPLSVEKRARKAVDQVIMGATATHPLLDSGNVTGIVWGGDRSLYNPLTYAVIDLQHAVGGVSLRAVMPVSLGGVSNRFQAGIDLSQQNDLRHEWQNCNGVDAPTTACPALPSEKGAIELDQREIVSNIGPYARDEIAIGSRVRVTGGLRGDVVSYNVTNHDLANGGISGSRTMSAVSPMGGLLVKLAPTHAAYANVSTAFETPTTTELDNQPTQVGGLNTSLNPQLSTSYEVGLKGVWLLKIPIQYDIAGYDIEVRDELVPFEIPNTSNETYYRNAGRTRRTGAEASAHSDLGPVELALSYTFSRFRYVDFSYSGAAYGGNVIPGIPGSLLQGSATYKWRSLFVTAEGRMQTHVFVNDANSTDASGFLVMNARVGGYSLFGRPWLSPVFGVNNIFNRTYIGSIVANASAGKYFEPSPGRTWFAGVAVGTPLI
jgi:iron complex outermembrane recepter protein